MALAIPALAEGSDARQDVLFDRIRLTVAGYLPYLDTEMRLDSKQLGTGVRVSMEDDLGLDDSKRSLRLEGGLWLARRHRLAFSLLELDRVSTTTVVEEIRWEDEVFVPGVEVVTVLETRTLELQYSYWPVSKERLAVGLTTGFQVESISAGITETGFEVEEDAAADVPVPFLGVDLRYAITRRLVLEVEAKAVDLSLGDYAGSLYDLDISLEYRAFRYLGLGFGFSGFDLDGTVDDEDFLGGVEFEHAGVQLFARFRY
jgi:hypothetical protein